MSDHYYPPFPCCGGMTFHNEKCKNPDGESEESSDYVIFTKEEVQKIKNVLETSFEGKLKANTKGAWLPKSEFSEVLDMLNESLGN